MDDLLSIAVSNAVAATVLALAALAVGTVYRRPALIHGLWLLVLLKLVTPPLLYLPVSWPTIGEPVQPEVADVSKQPMVAPPPAVEEREAVVVLPVAGEAEPPNVEAPSLVAELPYPAPAAPPQASLWPPILSIIWGVGALAWFLLALERLHRFRRLLRFAHPASAALQDRTRRLAQSLGLKRCPRVRLLPGRVAPMLWAIGGPPRLLVPAGLLDLLNDGQLDTLLLHELAHLRRRDHWVRILEFVVMGLYWWHPVVWYARRELREAEEQCCDAWVVSTLPESGRTYASALLDTLDFLSTAQAAVPPLASGLSQIADLKRRLTMIMRGNTPRSLTWPGCLAVVALGLTFLPMLPSLQGQAPGEEEDRAKVEVEDAKLRFEEAKARVERVKQRNIARLMKQYNELLNVAKYAEAEMVARRLKELDPENPLVAAAINQAIMLRQDSTSKELTKTLTISPGTTEKKAPSRIVITIAAPADAKADEVKLIIGSIQDALPEKFQTRIERIELRVADGARPTAPPPLKSSETRINELEKKLEKVLQELHELRKQMKDPRSKSSEPHWYGPPSTVIIPPSPPADNPYYAPTVPLKNAPVDPLRP